MTIQDHRLRSHIEKVSAIMTSIPLDEGEAAIRGLLDGWYWFQWTEGQNSLPAKEALELLLSEELRPALRKWYKIHGNNMNQYAIEFRDYLGGLAGEKFD